MENFTRRLNNLIEELNLTDLQIAATCKVSLGTVRRWKAGESAPHPFGQESVFRTLETLRRVTND